MATDVATVFTFGCFSDAPIEDATLAVFTDGWFGSDVVAAITGGHGGGGVATRRGVKIPLSLVSEDVALALSLLLADE